MINFNNSYNSLYHNYHNKFIVLLTIKLIILKAKLNFNLLKINSIAISSAIMVGGLLDYLYVRIIDDFAIFP